MKRDWLFYAAIALLGIAALWDLSKGHVGSWAFEIAMLVAAWIAPRFIATLSATQLKFVFPISAAVLLLIVVNLGKMHDGSIMASVQGMVFILSVVVFAHIAVQAENRLRELRSNTEGQIS